MSLYYEIMHDIDVFHVNKIDVINEVNLSFRNQSNQWKHVLCFHEITHVYYILFQPVHVPHTYIPPLNSRRYFYLYLQGGQLYPPTVLLDFQPLAAYCNHILTAFNELRLCAPISLAIDVAMTLQASLLQVNKVILAFHRWVQSIQSTNDIVISMFAPPDAYVWVCLYLRVKLSPPRC